MTVYTLLYLLQSSDSTVCNGYEIDNYWPNDQGSGNIRLMCSDVDIASFPDHQHIEINDRGDVLPIEQNGTLWYFEFKVLVPRVLPAAIHSLIRELLTQDVRATSEPQYRVMEDDTVIQTFFTNEAARSFIETHGHNYDDLHIYVGSGWKNAEWIAVRKYFMELPV